jgi:hypothetical protein
MPRAQLPTVRARVQASRQHAGKVPIPAVDLAAILDELQAARQVNQAARGSQGPHWLAGLTGVLAAYDRAVAP